MADDRYSMNPLDGPAQFAELLREFNRRLSALEGAPSAGSFRAPDDSGNGLVYLGNLPDGSSRGLEIVSEQFAWSLVKMTTDGWIKPHIMATSYDPAASKSVTAGSFALTWVAEFGEILGPGIEGFFTWATGGATTGEVRLTANTGGATDALALPAASSGSVFVRWLHGGPVGAGPQSVSLEARRTAGASNVAVSPLIMWVQDPAVCTSGGDWI